MICHFLIGVPGCGKSTFASQLAKLGNYRIVSTDAIRERLYGDVSIQGVWGEIQAQVISEIVEAIALGHAVIYDATNAKRVWRMELLGQLNSLAGSPQWMGWYLHTPLQTCKLWNQQRSRQVPEMIIENMHTSLQNFPPVAAEGFTSVNMIDVTSPKFKFSQVSRQIELLPRCLVNRANRNRHITLHSYSHLWDFERLMYLLALILRYPGIGNLQSTYPSLLENILGTVPEFTSAVAEITACMAKLYGNIYAQPQAIESDLLWLKQNFVIDIHSIPTCPTLPITLPVAVTQTLAATHPYSDFQSFQRLIQIIRFILHHPFLQNPGTASFTTLVSALTKHGIIDDNGLNSVRKDIEKILKPYQILPSFPMRDGYFAGTAILSEYELIKVFEVLQAQAKSLNDPIALEIFTTFATRMAQSKLAVNQVYPVRAIANRSMINPEYLPSDTLVKNLPQLEQAIANRQLLELNRFAGGGKFALDEEGFFLAFPLQIVFSNTAWYLGYECQSGKYSGLFRFERLDRLFMGQPQSRCRNLLEQQQSLEKLQKLATASAGIFLGYSASDQTKFLSHDPQLHSQVCVTVELWFNNPIYRFITEGTKRFPPRQMKMSPPVQGGRLNLPKSMFCLKKTKDKDFPNCFRVVLPKWSLGDVELMRWIVGFGGNVKVVQPPELVDKVKEMGQAIFELYQ
ncbi:MAG: WYL domain-containing protein [Nodularia sp. (in: Bacteria)]|nr:MAG: WYL domain-containing protein [Nodularia sp. (in: cyanobacteria)]